MYSYSTYNFSKLHVFLFILWIFSRIMNNRFIVVGIALGIIITIAFFVGSPMFGGFDLGK